MILNTISIIITIKKIFLAENNLYNLKLPAIKKVN